MIARAKLEVILGVLAPRLSGSVAEPVDTQADPAPQTSITVERIAVVSRASRTRSQSDRRDHRQPERQNDRSWRTARLRRRQKDQRAQRRADQAATRAAEHFLILSILFRRRHAGAPALWCGGSQAPRRAEARNSQGSRMPRPTRRACPRSASRMIATICSPVNLDCRIAPSESGASLSTYRWSENPGAAQPHRKLRAFAAIDLFSTSRVLFPPSKARS